MISPPAMTMGSLLQRATDLPDFSAFRVGARPTLPMRATITWSTLSRHTMSSMGVNSGPGKVWDGGSMQQMCLGLNLLRQQLDVVAGGQTHDLELVWERADDIQGLASDGPGRPKYHDSLHGTNTVVSR